jgi:hypothetical protein
MASVYQVVETTIVKRYHAVVASNEQEAMFSTNEHTFEHQQVDTAVSVYELYETDDEPVVTKLNGL